MGEPQIIRTPTGDEMVVVPRAEYEALRAAAEEAREDAEDLTVAQSRWAEWNASGRLTTPPDVARMILDGSHVLDAFRNHRSLSIEDLATRAGVEPSCIRAIEARETDGDAQTMSRLADGLGIDRVWLMPTQVDPASKERSAS